MQGEEERAGFTSLVAVVLSVQCRDSTILKLMKVSIPTPIGH